MKVRHTDLKEFVDEIIEWDEDPEIRESYPYGLSQLLVESSSNPKRDATEFIEFLYEKGFLADFIVQYKNGEIKSFETAN